MKSWKNEKKVTLVDQKFHYRMEFVEYDVPQAHRSVGVNTLYSKNKGNTYFLLDLNGLPSDNTWKILTNNYRFTTKIHIYLFRIKKYLTTNF